MASNRAAPSTAWAGWIIFAGTLLLMLGTFNIIEGLIALFDDERLAIAAGQLVLVDITGLGWLLLIFGVVMVLAGVGLLGRQSWARVTSIILVALHALLQLLWLGAYPVWAMLMIALDVVVIFALTARWHEATAALDPYDSVAPTRTGQHAPTG
jgi:hypothetical protein